MAPDEIRRATPELPRLVDAWQSGSLDEASHQKLTDLLRERWDARQYFLEQCQIDAELRWRFGAQAQIAGALARQEEGAARPIAAIVLSGLGFRDDPGFPAVFDKIETCEPLARQWLQVYLTLRACMFLCLSRPRDAEAAVKAICVELAGHPLEKLSPERFAHLACEVTCRAVDRQFLGTSTGMARPLSSIVRRCLECSEECDVVAMYESLEGCVPRYVPADALRLLCMRYLLEQSPQQIAASLKLPSRTVRSRLMQARLQIWKACVAQLDVGEVPEELRVPSALTCAIDQPEMQGHVITRDGLRMSREGLWHGLNIWSESSHDRCRQLLTFAILHEALFRRLSLNYLLEVSKTRRDEEFHVVATEMVLHLEEAADQTRRVSSPRRRTRSSRTSVAWVATTAAALLVAASAGIWWSNNSPEVPAISPSVAEGGGPVVEPVPSQPVPVRTHAAVVKTALEVAGPVDEKLRAGAAVYSGDRIELAAGIVHLTTPSGSEWVLEGPISVVMKERGEISLHRGKLVGLNRGQGEPLLVHTPVARVMDKGTEFGVSVGDDLTTSVAVYEGAVELSPATDGTSQAANSVLHIDADFEAAVQQSGILPSEPVRSAHSRAFIRPDEVELREQQQQGSVDAAEKVTFFELLRVEGLLAYQGFHSASSGQEFALGFLPPRAELPLQFGEDLVSTPGGEPSSKSLLLTNGSTVFLNLDVSDRSPVARAGLLNASSFVGEREAVVWLCWRSKLSIADGSRVLWTGLSLMHGDMRQAQEPLFLGQPAGTAHLGLQIFIGQNEVIQHFDTDLNVPEAQKIASDNRPHLWVARIAIQSGGGSTVSAWCDVDPAQIDSTAPHAEQPVADLKFDRLRFEVSKEGDHCQCAYDEVYLTTSLEALVEAMKRPPRQATP